MSKTLVVNNTPFEYPQTGDQNYGEAATGWAVAVTETLASVSGPADILETSDTVNNNQTTFLDIANFVFDSSSTRSFSVRGNVYRTYGSSEVSEEFLLVGLFQGVSGWILQQEGLGDAGITFNISSVGQVQYKSSNLVGAPYSGIIKFRGVGILNN
jgi:hypothetical protein